MKPIEKTSEKTVVRAFLRRGKMTRKLIIVDPPFPRPGDVLTEHGLTWIVEKIEEDTLLLQIPLKVKK